MTVLSHTNKHIKKNHYCLEGQEQLHLENKMLDFDNDLNLRNCTRTKLRHSVNFDKPTKSFCTLAKAHKGKIL